MLDILNNELHYIVIDGVPSSDFGVYVTNAGSYNAPMKNYELKSVDGRNGGLYIDNGNMDNIEVEYPAFIADNFQEKWDAFISFLLSKTNYFRLEDTIRPDVFRHALYIGGTKPKVTRNGKKGTFEIVFSCKPQRFLKEGEKPIEFEDTYQYYEYLKNPTNFPASPLIEVYGYGDLKINDFVINLQNATLGNVKLIEGYREEGDPGYLTCFFDYLLYDNNDPAQFKARWWVKFTISEAKAGTIKIEDRNQQDNPEFITEWWVDSNGVITIGGTVLRNLNLGDTYEDTYTSEIKVKFTNKTSGNDSSQDVDISVDISIGFDKIIISSVGLSYGNYIKETKQIDYLTVDSSASALGDPTYIDTETGDAYKYERFEKIYVNGSVWIGEKLPVLIPGDNSIIQGANMTKVVIYPRWWTI